MKTSLSPTCCLPEATEGSLRKVNLRRDELKVRAFVDGELSGVTSARLRDFRSFASPSRSPTDGFCETPSFPVRGTSGQVT